MESISQLRAICQKPKISDREDIGMNYHDFKTKFEMGLSIYFTWVFIRFGVSANIVTTISGIFALIGGVLFAFNNIWLLWLGILFLELYNILDFSDGEIARYHKSGSIFGWFIDWYMLFIRDAAMFTGLAICAYLAQPNLLIILCGFFAVLTPLMDKTIMGCGWTVISWQRLVKLQKGKLIESLSNDKINSNYEKSELDKNILSKNNLFFILLQRIWRISISIFQHHWSLLVLAILFLAQMAINYFFALSIEFIPYLIIYCGCYGPFYVLVRLFRALKENSFQYKYDLLFHDKNKVKSIDYII